MFKPIVKVARLIFTATLFHSVTGFTSQLAAKTRNKPSASIRTKKFTAVTTTQLTMNSSPISKSDHVLFDMPVSNNGARCRIILYKKNISQDQVEIISPVTVGGLKSEEYLALSPNGLMPSLSIQKNHSSGMKHISESDTIARYLLSEYSNVGPSFLLENPRSNQITRWHDMYLTTIQGCLVSANPLYLKQISLMFIPKEQSDARIKLLSSRVCSTNHHLASL